MDIKIAWAAALWMLFAIFAPASFAQGSGKCDEFDCDYNLCDSRNPCNRGCKCVYPQGAKVGYCEVWYKGTRSTNDIKRGETRPSNDAENRGNTREK